MKKIEKALLGLLSVIVVSLSLTGCHKNPLINNEDIIHQIREKFFLRSENFPIVECAHYYSDHQHNTALEKKCTHWTQMYYQDLVNSHSISSAITLEDFRDPIFWKQVKAAKR